MTSPERAAWRTGIGRCASPTEPRSAAAPLEDQLAGMTALLSDRDGVEAFLDEGARGHRLQARYLAQRRFQRCDHRVVVGLVEVDQRHQILFGRVRLRRIMLGLSQDKLGEALGLTFQQVQKYEKGVNRIGASRIRPEVVSSVPPSSPG